ncbi:pathogenesis-related homeodomain protein isoform X3 [Camellia sinensis]|uniref:pathogenesis-related homeodomain protein isoform X3 n=1 Tax=Camellia sinensis TaxID=4442 RepID=UPI001035DFF9|nr:pathogenesis-related homeodomain protein isoform X3 [Camellia sinensis]
MRGGGKKLTHNDFGKHYSNKAGSVSKQSAPLKIENGTERLHMKRHKPKLKSHGNSNGSTVLKKKVVKSVSNGMRNNSSGKNVNSTTDLHKTKSNKKQHSSSLEGEDILLDNSKEIGKQANGDDVKSKKLKKRRKRRRQRDNTELDEASRLKRRARYLLIKVKLELNLIEAYSGEGWKGQSREKIKPENELQRAKKQILKCKLGIRDAIHQLDLLSSVGCIEGSAIAPDGSVYHEHIICAKCKLREAFPDNDIILCDGTCNCAFHQKCLDPPLLTENIPPEDQGWFCKFCECKMEILDAMNAHLGTHFSADSHWQEMFGKDALVSEQISEDEDWGPAKRKRREKESDAATTLMTLSESEKKFPNVNTVEDQEKLPHSGKTKRSFFRIPPNAVEKLRIAFAENELPSKAVKDNLSQQLGIESEKVNKWFKNARYIALKARKTERAKKILCGSPKFTKESRSKIGKDKTADPLASKDISSTTAVHSPRHLKKASGKKNVQYITYALKKKHHKRALYNSNKADMEFGDDVSLKILKAFAKKKKKRVNLVGGGGVEEAEAELERLCKIKGKVEKLQKVLLGLPNHISIIKTTTTTDDHSVVYVPVAELREKR